ncbi:MAG: 4-alpha-glucanotransferase, partial [Candidatus Omnitrophica bacterium]|nr:4-alpha-glucanotransferase [Candidatus Omnitrophota bacterium]
MLNLTNLLSKEQWQRVSTHKRSGALVPLFSVYSKKSLGIGDSADLKLVVDWAKLTGNSILQLLPLNELGGFNCPYDSVSSFALEPAYLCLRDIPGFRPEALCACPNGGEFVDYSIKKEKLRLLWEIFLPLDLSQADDFEQFQKDNAYWLVDFALFKVLKDFYQGKPWYEWPNEFKNHCRQAIEDFRNQHIEAFTFQLWLQWLLFKQFRAVKEYASKNDILLKGDLPILVSRDSADVWSHPGFFKLDFASGAPPDMYCAKGQRWGMPTYNWQNIRVDGYRYIKEKLKYAENFYDILRIDHVVGLFRIWSIPYADALENQGLNGQFDPQEEYLWQEHGRNILDILV